MLIVLPPNHLLKIVQLKNLWAHYWLVNNTEVWHVLKQSNLMMDCLGGVLLFTHYLKISKLMRNLRLVSAIFYQTFIFFTKWQPFKNYEKRFLFHQKSSFHSQDIQIFVFFPLLSTFSRYKRPDGCGIIYVMNWLA